MSNEKSDVSPLAREASTVSVESSVEVSVEVLAVSPLSMRRPR